MRLPIHLQREIARLHFHDPNQFNRAIARSVGVSPNTVMSLREALVKASKPWSTLESMDDDGWCATLGTTDRSIAQRKEQPDWDWVHAEMQRRDATLEQLWREWKEGHPAGIAYSQFTSSYALYVRTLHVTMRSTHRPGDKLFVDFAGATVEIRNREGNPSTFAQIFVAVLGYSNYNYIEAVASQSTEDYVQCHVNCFAALGGSTNWVVSDNLKAAVLRREKDRVVINPAYRDCLRHYGSALMPTGVRKPKHKAKVEVGVQIVQRWVLFSLRDRVFFSLDELNAELRLLTAKLNAHPFRKMAGCRKDRFEETERATLKPLPATEFEPCDWRYGVLVGDDHHIEHNRCYYSVPVQLRGQRVDLRFTRTTIEAMYRGRRVALHALLTTPGDVSTVPEHRPVAHQRVLDGEPKALMTWAESVGPQTASMIRHHLTDRHDLVNGLKSARRMRDLARLHGDQRFEEACAYALPLNITALRSLTSILNEAADRRHAVSASPTSSRGSHTNVRGGTYYGEQQ